MRCGRDAGLLVRITGSQAAARSRVKLSLLDLPLLPQELAELLLPEHLRPQPDGTAADRQGTGNGASSGAGRLPPSSR